MLKFNKWNTYRNLRQTYRIVSRNTVAHEIIINVLLEGICKENTSGKVRNEVFTEADDVGNQ
jgi:hypothetical protein